jgi:P-type Cu+ transporter
MKDPVCGMDVAPESAAAAWEHDGRVYYFCSLGCLDRFKEDPERYLGPDDAHRGM